MTRVLVVQHDGDTADQEVDWLRRSGYAVQECAGPLYGPCPVLEGRPCAAADHADVLVYDVAAAGAADDGRSLIEQVRRHHPRIPVVVTGPQPEVAWASPAGAPGVVPLPGVPTGARLRAAVALALSEPC